MIPKVQMNRKNKFDVIKSKYIGAQKTLSRK